MLNPSLGSERWRQLLDECQRSGLSIKDFAERNGVTASALYYWRRRLAAGPMPVPSTALAVSFVELRCEDKPAPRPTPSYQVGLRNGRVVTVPSTFDDDVLHRLLAVAEGVA